MTLEQLAAMDHDAFLATFGNIFEHSPWVAEAAWPRRPFASENALHDAMMASLRAVPLPQQIAFLNGHPELAGKEAQVGTMTGHSTFEQQHAGMNALTHEELQELRRLNGAYLQRHEFPFIINVLGHTRAQIFEALRTRAHHETPREITEAMDQVAQITRRRLHALFAGA